MLKTSLRNRIPRLVFLFLKENAATAIKTLFTTRKTCNHPRRTQSSFRINTKHYMLKYLTEGEMK